MSLLKLRTVPFLLIEDDKDKNTLPLLLELTQSTKDSIQMFCYEQPIILWKNAFRNNVNIIYRDEFVPNECKKYTEEKTTVIIDSLNQMALLLGWNECLSLIKSLSSNCNVSQLIVILHQDCLIPGSKIQSHINHMANAVISYDKEDGNKVSIMIKKSGKVSRSKEIFSYDSKNLCLKLIPIENNSVKEPNTPNYPNPGTLSTFKIEVAQLEKIEKNKLDLPYMSKINYGESKVYYEPDAVDDWDEEDPDDDLDI